MRGFPLLNAVLVVTVFVMAAAAGPLRRLAEPDGGHLGQVLSEGSAGGRRADDRERPLDLRLYATQPWQELRVELLGQTVVELEEPSAGGRREIQLVSDPVPVPPEGIELWVEARFVGTPGGGVVALGVEVTPEGMAAVAETLWSDEGGTVADSVGFVWD